MLAHYLPQMYLKRFARPEDERLVVFDRVTGKTRHDKPRNVAVVTDFYILHGPSGEREERIESEFLAGIEGDASPVIDALCAGDELSSDDRDVLAFFVALMSVRVPAFAQTHATFDQALARITFRRLAGTPERAAAFLKRRRKQLPFEPDEFSAFVRSNALTIPPDHNSRIKMMLEMALDLAMALRQVEWRILKSGTAPFVTGDGPMGFIPDPGASPTYGELSLHVRKFVAFSPTTCLCLLDRPREPAVSVHLVEAAQVDEINVAIARAATRLVIGQRESDLEDVVRRSGVRGSTSVPRTALVEWYDEVGNHSIILSVRVHQETRFPLRLAVPWRCRLCGNISMTPLFVTEMLEPLIPTQFTDWLDRPCSNCGRSPRHTHSSLAGADPMRLVPPEDSE